MDKFVSPVQKITIKFVAYFYIVYFTFNDDEVMDVKWIDYTELQKLIKENKLHPRQEWINEVIKYINKM